MSVDLRDLPVDYPRVQMGLPLRDYEFAQLSEPQQQALDRLHTLAMRRGKLTQKRYAELQAAYARACELGLGDYCPVIGIAARFRLDDAAVERADLAVVTSRVSVCFGCD